jgi:hypothetical protein
MLTQTAKAAARAAWKRAITAVTLGALLVLASSAAARASVAPGPGLKTCFWSGVVDRAQNNVLFPDANATYWYTHFTLPAGGSVVLHGQFPHARSMFLFNYHLVAPADGLNDVQIAPDPGSTNPFLPGANRAATNRSYTITVTSSPPPAAGLPRAPNTIYAGQTSIQLIYRVYLPDQEQDQTGGAGVPDATFVSPSGVSVGGQAACDALQNDGASAPNVLPIASPVYLALLAEDPFSSTHPAVSPAHWYALFNILRLAEPFYAGTWQQGLIGLLPSYRSGPAANFDADSSFIYSYVDRDLGPAQAGHNILVLHGKLPTTPNTVAGEATMQGGTQLRYWSLCMNDGFASGEVGDCLYDEQIPIDSQRNYTIVVSEPQDRPANATNACGIGWLDWGNLGDGFFRPTAGLLMIRNQLPNPSFTQAASDVTVPGTEGQVMGAYIPSANYETTAQFASTGCASGSAMSAYAAASHGPKPQARASTTLGK